MLMAVDRKDLLKQAVLQKPPTEHSFVKKMFKVDFLYFMKSPLLSHNLQRFYRSYKRRYPYKIFSVVNKCVDVKGET